MASNKCAILVVVLVVAICPCAYWAAPLDEAKTEFKPSYRYLTCENQIQTEYGPGAFLAIKSYLTLMMRELDEAKAAQVDLGKFEDARNAIADLLECPSEDNDLVFARFGEQNGVIKINKDNLREYLKECKRMKDKL